MADFNNDNGGAISPSVINSIANAGAVRGATLGGDDIYQANRPALAAQIGDTRGQEAALASLGQAAMQSANESKDISTWLDNEGFQNQVNQKYSWQGEQMGKGVAAAGIVGSAEVAAQVAERKIGNLEKQKVAYDQLAEAGSNLFNSFSLPPGIGTIAGLFSDKYNMGSQLQKAAEASMTASNLQKQDALDDQLVLQRAFGQAGYNPLANDIIEPFNKWEGQYVQEQVALQKNKIAAQANKNNALSTALGVFQQQNKRLETLAVIHHDEVAERQNVINKADAAEERELSKIEELGRNQRTAVQARVHALQQQTANRAIEMEAVKQAWEMDTYPDTLAQQERRNAIDEEKNRQDAIRSATDLARAEIMAASQEAARELDYQKLKAGEESRAMQKYVADSNLKGKQVDYATQQLKLEAKKIGKSGDGKDGSVGKESYASALAIGAEAAVNEVGYETSKRQIALLNHMNMGNEATQVGEVLLDQGYALKEKGIAEGDKLTAATGVRTMTKGLAQFDKGVEEAIKSQPKNLQPVVKAIINNPSHQLERKDTVAVNEAIVSGDANYSSVPFINEISGPVTEEIVSSIIRNAESTSGKKTPDYYNMNAMEVQNAYLNNIGESKGGKLSADDKKQIRNTVTQSIIKDALEAPLFDDETKSAKARNDDALTNRVEFEIAKQIGNEVNAESGKQIVDVNKLTEKDALRSLAYQMGSNFMSNEAVNQQFAKTKQPSYVDNAINTIRLERASWDPAGQAWSFALGTDDTLANLRNGFTGVGQYANAVNQQIELAKADADAGRQSRFQNELAIRRGIVDNQVNNLINKTVEDTQKDPRATNQQLSAADFFKNYMK